MVLSVTAPRLRRFSRPLAAVVFPPVCIHCRGLVADEDTVLPARPPFRHLCEHCADRLPWVRAPHCRTCGHPFHGIVEGPRPCPRCAGLEPAYGEARTALLLEGPARSLIIELKYHRGRHLLGDCESLFRRSPQVLDHARGARLVPVPLHPRKLRERGYNQSLLLAERLAAAAGDATQVAPILFRRVDTATQTAFDREARRENLKNAFALAPSARLEPALRHVLVDDVFTTGSTVNACARALRQAGVRNLDVVTLAHG